MKIGIIGGGAAGFFAAINAKENYPSAKVIIYEKSHKVLVKVRISGGGRCNVTNGCDSIDSLSEGYPRGGKSIKRNFYIFNNKHTIEWFESRGLPLYTQDDNRVFPKSNNSESIIDCLMREIKRLNIEIQLGVKVKSLKPFSGDRLEIILQGEPNPQIFDKVIVATGGSPKRDGLLWLEKLNHKIEEPIPSLFTFKIPNDPIIQMMGLSVENVFVSIQGTKLKSSGPLLITHWGMSGPAILKLSAFGARILSEMKYSFKINVNWAGEKNNDIVTELLKSIISEHPNKLMTNQRPYGLPSRLWMHFLEKIEIPTNKTWIELGKKGLNKLMNLLTNDEYNVKGRTTFREEFVTCGGVSLQSIDMNTMQSKAVKNLYFAGEILDIDGITGGYNFQNAWTTGFIAGKLE
ncbi:MAG: NAD(P)/FAD-dependent oxidoreductase [Candidatus Kapabacteria bacterium]|nr:NAD(P)/FAD-dependent oxidoreductase [Candidatus Kapabacteria bacterium]